MSPADQQRTPPRIACLAWGSLVWKTAPLVLASRWHLDGPLLPIEFARVGDHGELGTVLLDGAQPVPTRWALLEAASVETARELLRRREEVPMARSATCIGSLPSAGQAFAFAREIGEWAQRQQLDAVVWTALPPRFDGEEGRVPAADEAVAYLRGLQGEAASHAEQYLRRVPADIDTPYRRVVQARLGWTPTA